MCTRTLLKEPSIVSRTVIPSLIFSHPQLFNLCRTTSSTSLLYLAQLADSPEEAVACFKAAVDLLSTRIDLSSGSFSNGKDKEWSPQERETRVQISRALVGMTELYLTDLW